MMETMQLWLASPVLCGRFSLSDGCSPSKNTFKKHSNTTCQLGNSSRTTCDSLVARPQPAKQPSSRPHNAPQDWACAEKGRAKNHMLESCELWPTLPYCRPLTKDICPRATSDPILRSTCQNLLLQPLIAILACALPFAQA